MKALCERDLSKECEGKYRNCIDCVLDKIRLELEEQKQVQVQSFDDEDMFAYKTGLNDAIYIIDKYK